MAIGDERIGEVLNGRDVDALVALIDDPQVSKDQRTNLVLSALHQLEELFYEDLPDLVVRICVEAPEETASDARQLFLGSWLGREGYHCRSRVITNLISRLRQTSGDQLVAAVRTAWVVGYRDDDLQGELVRIAGLLGHPHGDCDADGYALAALSAMTYSESDALSRALNSRLERTGHLTEPDLWTAMHAATPDMIPALLAAAATSDTWAAQHALLELASRYPAAAHDVWEAFRSLKEETRFLFASNVARRIDLEEVAGYLLAEALGAFQQYKQRNLLPPTHHLLHANLPNQIRAFLTVGRDIPSEQREWLRGAAVDPTRTESRFQTLETLNKNAAWSVILRLGLREARQWLPEAIANEANFTALELAEIASFLQVTEAVMPLANLVKNEALNLGIGVGCLKSLGILGTEDALGGLLESKVRIKNGEERLVPRELVKAMVSVCMTQHSCEAVLRVLLDRDADARIREACAYVIEDLSGFVSSPVPVAHDIVNLLRAEGEGLPGYDQLVLSLPNFKDDTAALDFLRELGGSGYESSKLTQALALTGLLNDFPERIEKMGFERTDEGWIVAKGLDDASAFALLFLHRGDPAFEPAVRQVLSDDSRHPAIQITANLRSTDRLSHGLRQALWDHALRWNRRSFADRSALEAVARTFPEKLIEDRTIAEVSQWGTSARRAYITSLRAIPKERGYAGAIARIACQFLVDEESSIRREAAWLARDSDPLLLREAIDRLAKKADELDNAVFMLDASFWLERGWEVYEQRGRCHREPMVRDLARRLSQERQERELARAYLKILLESSEYLDTWCYGQALLELGNEETIRDLYAGLPAEVYRRAYLIWLAKELEKRLEKKRRDQSEKVDLPPPLGYEEPVEVTIELGGERLGPFAGVLQESQARRARAWLWSWSVRIEGELDLTLKLAARDTDDSIPIQMTNRRRGRVLPVRMRSSIERPSDSHILLLGQGELEGAGLPELG
jgi:hypothetical protein